MSKNGAKKAIEGLYGKEELSDSYISFQIDLLEITEKYRELLKTWEIDFPKKEIVLENFEKGFPVISFTSLTLPLEMLALSCQEIFSVFNSYKIFNGDASSWWENHLDEQFIRKITQAIFSLDREEIIKLARPIPVDGITLIMLAKELVKPIFQELARQAKNAIPYKHWVEGACPTCGDMPNLARFSKGEEGKRYLWCSTCDQEWGYKRISCPFCGNFDHTKLRFLTTNHREEFRIDVCEDCKGYVKTIDERKIEDEKPIFYIRENVNSLFLDIVAEEKGYRIQLPTPISSIITFS